MRLITVILTLGDENESLGELRRQIEIELSWFGFVTVNHDENRTVFTVPTNQGKQEIEKEKGGKVGKILMSHGTALFPNEEIKFQTLFPPEAWDKEKQTVLVSAFYYNVKGKLEKFMRSFVVEPEAESR